MFYASDQFPLYMLLSAHLSNRLCLQRSHLINIPQKTKAIESEIFDDEPTIFIYKLNCLHHNSTPIFYQNTQCTDYSMKSDFKDLSLKKYYGLEEDA